MHKISSYLRCLKQVFLSRLFSTRSIVILSIFLMITYMHVSQIKDVCQHYDYAVSPWLFPFLMSSPYYLLMVLLGILYYYANVPFMQYTEMWKIIRLGRMKWASIQIAYIILSGFALIFFLYMFNLISVIPYLRFEADWGKVIHTLALTEIGWDMEVPINVSYDAMQAFSGMQATVWTLLIGGCVFSFLGLLLYTVSLYFARPVAIIIGGIIAIMHLLVDNLRQVPILSFFSPGTWMRLTHLSPGSSIAEMGFFQQRLPTIPYAICASALLMICCIIAILFRIKTCDFNWVWEDQ